MPSWPTQSDYKDSLQNPDTAFRDPDLRVSQAERSPMGVPRARSGAFASVYKMSRGAKAVALKLFNFPNDDRAARYQAVSDYLKTLGNKKPGALVGFEYHPEGIRVGRVWYPTLTMEWVKGKSLGEWVREAMERPRPDTAAVRKMADAWAQLVLEIQDSRIAHGDLQHDNVMVVGTVPVLVDYDGMCVPALADPRNPLEQLEFGKPAYQHPGRPIEKLGPELDHFAAWIILIALRAAASDPALYQRFVTKTENENLLFTPPDMVAPTQSALWAELLRSKDAEVRDWAKILRESLDQPFAQIPRFTLDPFLALRKLVVAVPRDWSGIAAETARLTKLGKKLPPDLVAAANPVGRLEELCKAAKLDYPAIATEADALTRSGKSVPDRLRPIAADAVKRVNCRDAVQRALATRDPRAVKNAFIKSLLESWADRRLIADAEAAANLVGALDRLKHANASPGDGKAFAKLWKDDGHKLRDIPEAEKYKTEAARWERQIATAEDFIRLFTAKASEQALAEAWKKVIAAGVHPTLLQPEHRTRGELAVKRAPVLARLVTISVAASFANDSALSTAWGDGKLLDGCGEALPYLTRVNTARERLSKVATLKNAIDAADRGTGSEKAVVDAARSLVGYDHPHIDRVKLGAKTIEALAALKQAVEQQPPSDRNIAAALDALRATNIELLARLDKVDANLANEATAAGRRRKALNEFAEIDRKYSQPDEQDRKWQVLWLKHKELLHGRRDTEELRERLTLAVHRTRAADAILKALDAREMFELRKLFDQHGPSLANYPPLMARKAELGELRARADRVIEIQKKLEASSATLTETDLQFLSDNHSAFRKRDKAAIVQHIERKLATDARLLPGVPPVRVAPTSVGISVIANWAWPGHGLVSHCLVAVDKGRHLNTPDEADRFGLSKCRPRDHVGGGRHVAPPPGASQVFVTVWAVVELGWTTVYGPPLHLGPAALMVAT